MATNTQLTDEEKVLAMRMDMMRKFGEGMKLLLNSCEVIMQQEKKHVIEAGCCEEYDFLHSFREEFEAGPIEPFYQVVRYFIETNRARLFSIVGNDSWLLSPDIYICATDGFVEREDSESDSIIPLGFVYTLANSMAQEELRKTTPNMDIVKMRIYVRLALITLCESVAYEQDAIKLRAIARTTREDLSIRSGDENNPFAPVVDVFRGFFSGILPETQNLRNPTMQDVTSFTSGAAGALLEHGSLIKDGLMGFHRALEEEKSGDISSILRNLASKASDPTVKEKVDGITNVIKDRFSTMLPTEQEEKDFFSRFLSVFDKKEEPAAASSSSSSSSSSS
jgi:hypothetical protein